MIDLLVIPLLKIVIVLTGMLVAVIYLVLLERKVQAWVQVRLGPMRVGPARRAAADRRRAEAVHQGRHHAGPGRQVGLHAGADHRAGAGAHRVRGDSVRRRGQLFGKPVPLYIADINVGLLYIVSVASIGVYGIILAGWSSNSKYPLLGGLRVVGAAHQLRGRGDADARERHPRVGHAEHGGHRRGAEGATASGSRSCSRSRSSSTSSAAWPRPTARRSTCRRRSRS